MVGTGFGRKTKFISKGASETGAGGEAEGEVGGICGWEGRFASTESFGGEVSAGFGRKAKFISRRGFEAQLPLGESCG